MRLLADECMPRRAFALLGELLMLRNPPMQSAYLVDHLRTQGAADDVWVPRIAAEGDWVVITTDTGRRSPRLPAILPAHRVPGVFLGGKMASLSGFDKVRAVLTLLPEIEDGVGAGILRFRVSPRGNGFVLSPWPV